MNWTLVLSVVCCCLTVVNANVNLKRGISVLNDYDPGSCNQTRHGHEVLVKNRAEQETVLVCTKDKNVYKWMSTDGRKNTVGEFFNPGYDCSNILDNIPDATDGFYWINIRRQIPRKAWCDMTTDGGGFILIGRKDNPMTYTFPSNDDPVEPFGKPHWTSSLGDAPILDFRVQMATSDDFKATKAHWLFRLKSKRPLKNLMITNAGCHRRSAGIGNIAYVKDLQTEKIVTTKLRCSKFGYAYHHLAKFGWTKMNSCLGKPCSLSFAYHDLLKVKLDFDGSYSYNTVRSVSGMEYNATASVGCDNGHCCGCYGPLGGTKNYCAQNCEPINGGKATKNVYTWFWIRSSLPKRVWKKCMDYQVKRKDGKLISHKLVGHSVLPVEGSCNKDSTLLHDGVVVVPDSSAAQKVPAIDGLLEYRKDKQELFIRSNKTWNALAPKNMVNNELTKLKTEIKDLKSSLTRLGILPLYKECYGYKWLTERSRNKNFASNETRYHDDKLNGWYRFGGDAGTKIPTTCVKTEHCGGNGAGWMNGTHPTVAEGKVARKVCYNVGLPKCCWQIAIDDIEVINCGQYYVYKLRPARCGPCRYCGTN